MSEPPPFPFRTPTGTGPPPEYERARQQPELPRVRLASGHPARLVTRYPDVRAVLADARFSRSAFAGTPLFSRTAESLPLITTDAPVHSRRRAAVAHPFTTRKVRRLRPLVAELVARQVTELAAGPPPADLVGGFAVPLTMRVMGRILGVPEPDLPRFKPWVDRMVSRGRFPADQVADGHRRLHDYFAELIGATRAARGRGESPDGLIAELIAPAGPEPPLSEVELVTLTAGLMIAGYETTSNVLVVVAYELLRRPELVARVRAEPARLGPVLEELLRYLCGNGTGGVPHVASEDVALPSGAVVPAGEVVVPIPDAANRDPAVFPEPDAVRPDRPRNPHVAFGHGPHYCLGAELARIELRIAVAGLLEAFPRLRVAVPDERLRWRTDMFVRGLWELPVRW